MTMNNKIILTALGLAAFALTATTLTHTNTANASNIGEPGRIFQTAAKVTPLASGQFSGRSDHITEGQVTLEKTAAGYQLVFAADFDLDGAPDPVVALGNSETFVAANKIGKLKNKSGRQVYQLPAGFTPEQFSEVYVWCEKFSLPLGVAKLVKA